MDEYTAGIIYTNIFLYLNSLRWFIAFKSACCAHEIIQTWPFLFFVPSPPHIVIHTHSHILSLCSSSAALCTSLLGFFFCQFSLHCGVTLFAVFYVSTAVVVVAAAAILLLPLSCIIVLMRFPFSTLQQTNFCGGHACNPTTDLVSTLK